MQEEILSKKPAWVEPLDGIPERQRNHMVSGMRWTLWLSVVSAPCGYITTVLLARVDPAVVGTYGLLSLYIGLTSIFLFFGGNGVVIKFLPELPAEKRLSFLISYFLVILATTLPFQIVASIWPKGLRYVLGSEAGNWFGVLLVWLAPFYILSSLILAALKGLLEIKWSQVYNRIITLTSFALYAILYFGAREFLASHYVAIIWSIYLVLATFVTILAMRRLYHRLGGAHSGHLRFFLPKEFWSFTSGLQLVSILAFLSTRLDYLFILNVGGLVEFGRYVTLITLVSVIPTFATFVLDSLLPSLTNTLALRDYESSRRLAEIYLRFILPCGMLAATFALLFAHPLFAILGSRYSNLVNLGLLAFPIAALQVLNGFVAIMFTAIGQPYGIAIAQTSRMVVFCAVFWLLWPPYHLWGAIVAWGIAELSNQVIGLFSLLRIMPFRFSFVPTYLAFLLIVGLSAVCARYSGKLGLLVSGLVWLSLVGAFFLAARYSWSEIRSLIQMVLPSRVSAVVWSCPYNKGKAARESAG
jgi:O-antigen/teichoic acid export membrane protein